MNSHRCIVVLTAIATLGLFLCTVARCQYDEQDVTSEYIDDEFDYVTEAPVVQYDPVPVTPSCAASRHNVLQTYRNVGDKFILLVSTMDGELQALNALEDGRQLWTMKTDTQPLIASTLADQQLEMQGELPKRLIPSLDGTLYVYDESSFQAVPISTDSLLGSSLRMGSDMISGGKHVKAYGVDAQSGKLEYSCTMEGCVGNTGETRRVNDRFVVRRKTQTVRAVAPESGAERWNLSVGEHEIEFLRAFVPHDINTDDVNEEKQENDKKLDAHLQDYLNQMYFQVNPAVGKITALLDGRVVWQANLNRPVAQCWELRGVSFAELSIFDPNVVPTLNDISDNQHSRQDNVQSMLYLGIYEKQKYVIPSRIERHRLDALLATSRMDALGIRGELSHALVPRDSSRLYLAATLSGTHIGQRPAKITRHEDCLDSSCPATTCSTKDANALVLREDFRKDEGFFLYKYHESVPKHSKVERLKRMIGFDRKPGGHLDSPSNLNAYLVTWSQACMLVMCSVLVTVAVMKCHRWRKNKAIAARRLTTSSTETSIEPVSSASDLRESSPDIRSSLSVPATLTGSSSVETEFESRFLHDFEVEAILGCGGFGVVYVAKNKVDLFNYAVKRVQFPKSEKNKHQYAREVRTMASYEHPNIVRYHHAWWEEPPNAWQDDTDKMILEKCGGVSKLQSILSGLAMSVSRSDVTKPKFSNDDDSYSDLNRNLNFERQFSHCGDVKPTACCNSASLKQCDICTFPSSTNTDESLSENMREFDEQLKSSAEKSESIVFADDSGVGGKEREIETVDGLKDKDNPKTDPNETGGFMYLYIQMQLCQKDTLSDWLWQHNTLESRPTDVVLDIFGQIVCGVKFVHDKKQIHRDLKPSNIFFMIPDANDCNARRIKIGDFGLVSRGEMENNRISVSPTGENQEHTDRVGTEFYMSPEQLKRGASYTNKVDMYALGLILFELIVPFSTKMERITVMQNVKKQIFPADFEDTYRAEADLIRKMVSVDPNKRPTASNLIQDPLIKEFCDDNWNKASKRSRNESSTGSNSNQLL